MSKTVTIYRSATHLSSVQDKNDKVAQDYFNNSNRSIGSYWESSSSQKVASGLSFIEEALLMPELIDTPPDDRDFRKKVTLYFVEINTKVDALAGRPLEIGLLDDEKALGAKINIGGVEMFNRPLNISDYVAWRHALKHPKVATTKESSDGLMHIDFYIFDKSEVLKKNAEKHDMVDTALEIYIEIKKDEKKVDMMLTMLAKDVRSYDNLAAKVAELKKLSQDKPKEFVTLSQATDLEAMSWIENMVATKVIKKLGEKYFDAETDKTLANSKEEMVYFLKDEDNSDIVSALKARLQEGMKQKAAVKKGGRQAKQV